MKLFPSPRVPTDKIPECRPHIKRGDHLRLYRFSPEDYRELAAVFNGPHPETGEDLAVIDEAPEGAVPNGLPSQPAVFAPDYAPEEIAEIARKLREAAGLPKEPSGAVAKRQGPDAACHVGVTTHNQAVELEFSNQADDQAQGKGEVQVADHPARGTEATRPHEQFG